MLRTTIMLCLLSLLLGSMSWGKALKPLGPKDAQRRLFAPYDMIKLNCLGMNYCESLLDMRLNIVSYTHLNSDSNCADAWHLHFPDDTARLMEGIAWESEFSPVVRLELARRITKGLISTHYPGTRAYNSFRHRSGGKTDQILADKDSGRVVLADLGDDITGLVKVGFRAERSGEWREIGGFTYTDNPADAGNPGVSRNPQNWNKSPYVFRRHYASDGMAVDFAGRSWLSDENMPLEFGFSSTDAERVQIVIGEPGKPMRLLANTSVPGIIELPDRRSAFYSDETGDKAFESPDFNYLILRKRAAWAAPGYSAALLIIWDGQPERIEALAENGYGQIRFTYPRSAGKAAGKVRLLPIQAMNEHDMEYLFRNAEHFLSKGRLMMNGFPPQQMHNAIPAGLAAGAYMLARYDDPTAPTVRINAVNAVDELFDAERKGMKLVRVFFPVRAAAWMVKTAKLLGDRDMERKYTADLDLVMKRMLSAESGYDGKGWPGGWDHFNSVKACWLAYDATGNQEYRQAWERALTVYTIDDKTIYRYGKPMDDPGGMNTYFGSMPMGVWGNAGMLEDAAKLITLDVLALPSWKTRTFEMWHDAGNGPWAQDDANPEYVGLCLRGANIPRSKVHFVPVGAFPMYDAAGKVELTNTPLVENPFFVRGTTDYGVGEGERGREGEGWTRGKGERGKGRVTSDPLPVTSEGVDPIRTPETRNPKPETKEPTPNTQHPTPVPPHSSSALVYHLDLADAVGAGLDLKIKGSGFKIEASPDGRRWYERLDTWSDTVSDQSIDLSFLAGSRDELIRLLTITPPDDKAYLIGTKGSSLRDSHCRQIAKDGCFVYKIKLPDVVECRAEVLAANGCRVECSSDGKTWHDGLVISTPKDGGPDAAWIRMLNLTPYLGEGTVFLRFSNAADPADFGGKCAYLRRLSLYGAMKCKQAFVRVSNVSPDRSFELQTVTLRTWEK